MTPILLVGDTVKGFLPDATSCVVTEERNGIFELELTYPVAGPMFGELAVDRYIKAKPNDTADLQLFRIYEITKPIAGIVTVRCEHISYALAHYPVTDVSGTGTPTQAVGAVLAKVNAYLTLHHAFQVMETGWATTKAYQYKVGSARAALGGSEGSVLDTFGGEFEWDNYAVKLHQHRGRDTGVVVAYRKNMTDLQVTTSLDSAYTALFPYAIKDDVLVTVTSGKIPVTNNSGIADRVLIRDFSSEFQGDEEVNATTLRAKADAYLAENDINAPDVSITVSFIHLWQSPEYADLAALERVSLCDWVTVRHDVLGVDVKAQVIKTEYDCIAERYVKIELGSARATFQDTLQKTIHDVTKLLQSTDTSAITQAYMQAIADATALITGADGGYVHLIPSQNPQEIVISDVEDYKLSTAKVWRWNKNGLGYSSTGYSGTYTTAITKDGKINASMITTGTINASLITAGVLQSADGTAMFDLESGEVKTYKNYGNYTSSSAMCNGIFRLHYNETELGGLGTATRDSGAYAVPWLFFNDECTDQLWIGHGHLGDNPALNPSVVIKSDIIAFCVDWVETANVQSDGIHGTVHGDLCGNVYNSYKIGFVIDGYEIANVQSDGIHGTLCEFETWKSGDFNTFKTYVNKSLSSIITDLDGKAESHHKHSELCGENGLGLLIGDKNIVTCYREGNGYKIDISDDTVLTGYAKEEHSHANYADKDHSHVDYADKNHSHVDYVNYSTFTNLINKKAGRTGNNSVGSARFDLEHFNGSNYETICCIGEISIYGDEKIKAIEFGINSSSDVEMFLFTIGTKTVAYIDNTGIHNGSPF